MKDIKFEIIGHVLIIREYVEESTLKRFAEKKMQKHPQIKTIALQETKISGIERKRELRFLFGKNQFETVYKEHKAVYFLNLQETFFSPRLSYERQRIAKLVKEEEIIINFFAGVGPFSIAIAKKNKKNIIHSVEINESAFNYLKKNIELNNCQKSVIPHLGDAFQIVPKKLNNIANRILLPLPLEADRALDTAIKALKNNHGIVHWQITEHVSNKQKLKDQIQKRIKKILFQKSNEISFLNMRIIRWLAPRIAHIAVDLAYN